MRRRQVVRGLVSTFALWLAFPQPLHAQGATLVAVAAAFTAAWNAHDVEGVLAGFAPGAEVRQTGVVLVPAGDGSPTGLAVEDVYGTGPWALAEATGARDGTESEVLWATGLPEIRVWLARLFAADHRIEASGYVVEGDTVIWRYRAFAAPSQRVAGAAPAEGTARLVVRAGRILALVVASDPATVARRARQLGAALDARLAAAPWPGGPVRPATAGRAAAADGPTWGPPRPGRGDGPGCAAPRRSGAR